NRNPVGFALPWHKRPAGKPGTGLQAGRLCHGSWRTSLPALDTTPIQPGHPPPHVCPALLHPQAEKIRTSPSHAETRLYGRMKGPHGSASNAPATQHRTGASAEPRPPTKGATHEDLR